MAARKSGVKRAPRRRAAPPRAERPALGNDPFERGAAVREPARPAPPAAVEPAPAVPALAEPVVEPAAEAAAPSPAAAPPPAADPLAAQGVAALRRRLDAVERGIASAADAAAARLRELARQDAAGHLTRDLGQAVAGLLPALRDRLSALAQLRALLSGPGRLDAFGLDRELEARAAPALELLYDAWWRVEVRDAGHVPSEGPVVVVANHGGALAWDALVLRLALRRDHPAHRELRPLLDDHALAVPLFGGAAARLGAVPATPENALRLLEAGEAVAVFPEGSRNAGRTWAQRYRIERFGRGGFARIALRAGAAVVPCAIVGSEEASAPAARPGWLAERLGVPFLGGGALPLAPLGLLPLPSRWSLRFGEPIPAGPGGPGAEEDQAAVLALAERTRAALQQMLDEDVAARRSVYL